MNVRGETSFLSKPDKHLHRVGFVLSERIAFPREFTRHSQRAQ